MLMTGAAFGLPTTLWLTDDCLSTLTALPANDTLAQLPDFGVRCVISELADDTGLTVEKLSQEALHTLRDDSQQVLVF